MKHSTSRTATSHFLHRAAAAMLCAWLIYAPGIAVADLYRVVTGDQLYLDHSLLNEPKSTTIDLDGAIRLNGLGRLDVAGKTLDEIELLIAKALLDNGFSGLPEISVEVQSYAPIVVSGFVREAGKFDYFPGLTVDVAIALAGGSLSSEQAQANITDLPALNAQRRLAETQHQIVETIVEIAFLTAALEGGDVEAPPDISALLPKPLLPELHAGLTAKTTFLASLRSGDVTLQRLWDKDVAETQAQIALIATRLTLKQDSIARLTQELTDLETLQQKGLTTTTRLSALSQRLADEREDLLSLETVQINLRRAQTQTERNRTTYFANLHQTRLQQLQDAEQKLDALMRENYYAKQELTAAFGAQSSTTHSALGLEIRYQVISRRSGSHTPSGVTGSTEILPGDILIVELAPALTD